MYRFCVHTFSNMKRCTHLNGIVNSVFLFFFLKKKQNQV